MASYKSNIWKAYLYNFLASMHFISGVLIPFFLDWGRISFAQTMILQSVFVFAIFFLEVPTGAIADRIGRKYSLALGALCVIIAAFVYSSYPNFYVFALGEIIWAAGGAFISGADEALVYDSLKKLKREKQSKRIFGRAESFSMGGMVIAAPIGSFIAVQLGLRYTMMLVAVPYFIACLVSLSFKEPKIKKKKESKRYLSIVVSGMKYLQEHKILKMLAFDRIAVTVLVFLIIWLYQPLLREIGIPLVIFGFVHAGICVSEMLVLNNFENLERIFGSSKKYLLLSAIIAGAGFVLLGVLKNQVLVIAVLLVLAGFGLTREILFQSYMNKYIESHNRATVISTISMIKRFITGIINIIIGFMVEVSLRYTFFIIGVLIIILALVSRVEEKHLID